MEESILVSIKKLIGLAPDDNSFDTDMYIHINSALDVLSQLGVGSDSTFYIEDDSATWADFLPNDKHLHMVKTYIAAKVRKWFDPPQNGSTMEALNSSLAELEWRINVEIDPGTDGE